MFKIIALLLIVTVTVTSIAPEVLALRPVAYKRAVGNEGVRAPSEQRPSVANDDQKPSEDVIRKQTSQALIVAGIVFALGIIALIAGSYILPLGIELSQMPEMLTLVGIVYTATIFTGACIYRKTKGVWNYSSRTSLALLSLLAATQFGWTAIFPHMVIAKSGAGFYILVLYPLAILLIRQIYPRLAGTYKKTQYEDNIERRGLLEKLHIYGKNEIAVLREFRKVKLRLLDEMPGLAKLSRVTIFRKLLSREISASRILILGAIASQSLGAPPMYQSFSMQPNEVKPVEWTVMSQFSIILPMILEWLRGKKPGIKVWAGMFLVCASVALYALLGSETASISFFKWSTLIAVFAIFSYGFSRFFINWSFEKADHSDRKNSAATIGYRLGLVAVPIFMLLGLLGGPGQPFSIFYLIASSFFNAVAFSSGWMLMLLVVSTYNSLEKDKDEVFGLPILLTFMATIPLFTFFYKALLLRTMPSLLKLVSIGMGLLGVAIAYIEKSKPKAQEDGVEVNTESASVAKTEEIGGIQGDPLKDALRGKDGKDSPEPKPSSAGSIDRLEAIFNDPDKPIWQQEEAMQAVFRDYPQIYARAMSIGGLFPSLESGDTDAILRWWERGEYAITQTRKLQIGAVFAEIAASA